MGVFADTWFYVAFIDARDLNHEIVQRYADSLTTVQVTTRWVLAELANFASVGSGRSVVAGLIRQLENHSHVRIIGESDGLFHRGLALYERRPDKEWSLTDCISFVVMEDEGIREALTNDHHFTQAGYVAVFADAS